MSVLALSLMTSPAHGQFTKPAELLDLGKLAAGKVYQTANTDLLDTLSKYLNTAFGLLGIAAIALIIWAGFKWMTARGEEEEVKKAQDIIRDVVIGLIVLSLAYAITSFVFNKILTSPPI